MKTAYTDHSPLHKEFNITDSDGVALHVSLWSDTLDDGVVYYGRCISLESYKRDRKNHGLPVKTQDGKIALFPDLHIAEKEVRIAVTGRHKEGKVPA